MRGQRIAVVAVVIAAALVTGGWLLQRDTAPEGSVYQQARLFDDVLAHVADYYVDSIDERKLYQMAIDGFLDELHDPYSVYLKPDDYHSLSEQTSGDYAGLGFQFEVRNGYVTVVAPLPDSPAERAGLQTGDQITQLNGTSTQGWKDDSVRSQMRGPAGTVAVLTVRRAGVDAPMTFNITRAKIHVRSVQIAMMLNDKVGYVSLSPVSETSALEVEQAVDSLRRAGMKSLIFDLRSNPGGLLDQGIAVSDLFLDPGAAIVATRGRMPGSNQMYRDSSVQRWPSLPVVTLVNGGTASAAEIISGALQDHDRSIVIGTPTFGKGLVQSLWRLTPETALKLTTARWYTPSGRTIQRKSKDQADQEAQVIAAELGRDTTKVDSSLIFHTDRGRTVLGGGGIHPDIFVAPDTFTTAERAFSKALGNKIPVFQDVLGTYALELKGQHTLSGPNFQVTDAMVDEVLRRMRAKGVVVSDAVVAGAHSLLVQEIGYQAARYSFGKNAEFSRRMADDRQVQQALTLAQKARTPAELLSLAAVQASESNRK
jgi:carboxyl-terminal processing protease